MCKLCIVILQIFINSQFTPAEDDEIDEFVWMADNMYIPFDEEIGYHPQYDDFDPFSEYMDMFSY